MSEVSKRKSMDRKATGSKGEDLAAQFLRGKGYRILERNFRCPLGEIDIVAEKGKWLVFVEVRSRRSAEFGTPEESVTASKRQKLVSLALTYLQTCDKPPQMWRIDVVTVRFGDSDDRPLIEHIENAVTGD